MLEIWLMFLLMKNGNVIPLIESFDTITECVEEASVRIKDDTISSVICYNKELGSVELKKG